MAKKAMLTENQSDVDLTNSFKGQLFKDKISRSLFCQIDVNDSTSVLKWKKTKM